MFPVTDMAGIEFVAYIDMRVRSKITLGDALGIDIKAMNKPIPEGMLSLDPQICTYAWVTGISDWAFLNLNEALRFLFSKKLENLWLDKLVLSLNTKPLSPQNPLNQQILTNLNLSQKPKSLRSPNKP